MRAQDGHDRVRQFLIRFQAAFPHVDGLSLIVFKRQMQPSLDLSVRREVASSQIRSVGATAEIQ